jgi:FixJ family two-component response regulator
MSCLARRSPTPPFSIATRLICQRKIPRAVLLILTNADAGTKPTIIVIDDDAAIRKALVRLLRADGWPVSTYPSAEAFLQASTPNGTGCLILDIDLPGMSGLDLQRRLALSAWRYVPIIFITGSHPDDAPHAQAMQGGAHAIFGKPISGHSLLQAVRSATKVGR